MNNKAKKELANRIIESQNAAPKSASKPGKVPIVRNSDDAHLTGVKLRQAAMKSKVDDILSTSPLDVLQAALPDRKPYIKTDRVAFLAGSTNISGNLPTPSLNRNTPLAERGGTHWQEIYAATQRKRVIKAIDEEIRISAEKAAVAHVFGWSGAKYIHYMQMAKYASGGVYGAMGLPHTHRNTAGVNSNF